MQVGCMSMGLLMEEQEALAWRGPMAGAALQKLLQGTQWGELDVLLVDMPPGTGDTHITLGQACSLSGAVVVSTPQSVALEDARRAAKLYAKLNVPVLGVVENMAYHLCRGCGSRSHLFGRDGAAALAAELGLELLAQLPLEAPVCELSDSGVPVTVVDPEADSSRGYLHIALRLKALLFQDSASGSPPVTPTRVVIHT